MPSLGLLLKLVLHSRRVPKIAYQTDSGETLPLLKTQAFLSLEPPFKVENEDDLVSEFHLRSLAEQESSFLNRSFNLEIYYKLFKHPRRNISFKILIFHTQSKWAPRTILTLAAGFGAPDLENRKKLDPLEAYVPAVLLTEAQFEELEKTLDLEQPEYDISRSLLRSGPAASLRVNIRAVAQYAADDGKGQTASDDVDRCLRALEDLDSLLLNALRNDRTASVVSMKSKISIALAALDSLLQTVPTAVLDKGKAIAESYRMPSNLNERNKREDLEPDLKQLEALL